jgi:serine/threonine protein kinase
MHKYGYVHRDISTGNILFHKGRGKLSDLEYSKEMVTGLAHEVRTVCFTSSSAPLDSYLRAQGTAYFMAIEIAMLEYLFEPLSVDDTTLLFQYNPLHDLESIWWITNYFLFYGFTVANHDQQALDQDSRILFPSNGDLLKRISAFKNARTYKRMLSHLPPSFQQLGEDMNKCRFNLGERYTRAEAGAELDPSAFDEEIYRLFIDAFTLFCDSPTSEEAVRKRLREEEGDAEEDDKDVLPKLLAKKGKSKRQKSR